jgi:Zn-dependent peptidase ImmA (M78 family)
MQKTMLFQEDYIIQKSDEGNSFRIILPNHTSSIRDIFTIAHELGHLFIHMDYGTKKFKQQRLNRFIDHMDLTEDNIIQEKEANHFDENFLMPEKLFRKKFKSSNGDIEKLSEYFGVSKSAISSRAKFFNLIED